MKIFITGSSGFIGFHLSRKLLDKGHSVYGFDSMNSYYDIKIKKDRYKILNKYKKFSFKKSKLENQKILSKSILEFKPQIIIHLAAQAGVRYSIENPRVYLDTNIIGTYNIIELAKEINIKHLIIASSSSVYGANKNLPFKEIDKTETQLSIYAATKKSTESIAHSCSNIWKVPITMLRFFTVYGPWGRPDMALFIFTKNILEGKKIDLFNFGNHIRDFTYIDDIIEPILRLINKPPKNNNKTRTNDPSESSAPFKIYNIGNNNPKKLMEFVKAIESKLNKKAKINLKPLQKGDVYETYADTNKLLQATRYKSKTDIDKGIGNFIDWFRSYYKC